MEIKDNASKTLKLLWEMRDNANTDSQFKKAQEEIDDYFLGKPEKKKRKKKKKIVIPEDDWEE